MSTTGYHDALNIQLPTLPLTAQPQGPISPAGDVTATADFGNVDARPELAVRFDLSGNGCDRCPRVIEWA